MTAKTQTATLRIERIMKAPPERVYKAYLDRTQFATLNSGQGHTTKVETLEPKAGGAFRYTMGMNDGSRSQAYVGPFLELTEFTKSGLRAMSMQS